MLISSSGRGVPHPPPSPFPYRPGIGLHWGMAIPPPLPLFTDLALVSIEAWRPPPLPLFTDLALVSIEAWRPPPPSCLRTWRWSPLRRGVPPPPSPCLRTWHWSPLRRGVPPLPHVYGPGVGLHWGVAFGTDPIECLLQPSNSNSLIFPSSDFFLTISPDFCYYTVDVNF